MQPLSMKWWITPVDCGARKASQHCNVWEAGLVQHNQDRQANGDGQALLHAGKHDAQPGSIEDNPVKLVDLQHKVSNRSATAQAATAECRCGL